MTTQIVLRGALLDQVATIADTATRLLDVMPSMETAWEHFTCTEVDLFARFADTCGRRDVATAILVYHAQGDSDPDDMHAPLLAASEQWPDATDFDASLERASIYLDDTAADTDR